MARAVSPRRIRLLRRRREAGVGALRGLDILRGRAEFSDGGGAGARRDRYQWARPVACWSGLLLILAGSLMWLAYGTSVLGVRTVLVQGADVAGVDQVLAAAAVAEGTPLARVDTRAVAGRVGALPAVASVQVRRSWPSTLVIAVTERVGVAAVETPAGLLVVDRDGVPFLTVPDRGDLPLLRVSQPGPDDPATQAGLRVLAALTPQLRADLVAVAVPSPTRIQLELTGSRRVIWGDAEASEQKAQVATVLLAEPATTIDVSAPGVAVVS